MGRNYVNYKYNRKQILSGSLFMGLLVLSANALGVAMRKARIRLRS